MERSHVEPLRILDGANRRDGEVLCNIRLPAALAEQFSGDAITVRQLEQLVLRLWVAGRRSRGRRR